MSGAVSGALARFRLRSHKFPAGRLFNGSGNAGPPEGMHADAGRTDSGSLPVPSGAT